MLVRACPDTVGLRHGHMAVTVDDRGGSRIPRAVQPTLITSPDVSYTCQAWRGGRAWSAIARRHCHEVIPPDLSRDIIVNDGLVQVTPRAASPVHVPLARGAAIRGLRLPMAATDIHVDARWSGWTACDAVEGTGLWDRALSAGALSWEVDDRLQEVIDYLDRPFASIADMSTTLYLSQRTVRRRSLEWFSGTPVQVRRVLRCWRFLTATSRGHTATEAAGASGFADRAHASRDIRWFLGGLSNPRLVRLAE